jgi:hypothetical protein
MLLEVLDLFIQPCSIRGKISLTQTTWKGVALQRETSYK